MRNNVIYLYKILMCILINVLMSVSPKDTETGLSKTIPSHTSCYWRLHGKYFLFAYYVGEMVKFYV